MTRGDMISSRPMMEAIRSAGYSGDRDMYIPNIEDASREFYDKHLALLDRFKGQFGDGPWAHMHNQLWDILSKTNEIGHTVADIKNDKDAQQRIEGIIDEMNPKFTEFAKSTYMLGLSSIKHNPPTETNRDSMLRSTFDYVSALYRRPRV